MGKNCKRRDSSGTMRDYCKEAAYEATPEQKKHRAMRNKANRALLPGRDPKGVEVDHRQALAQGCSNAPSNWRILSRSRNRGKRAAAARG